MEGMVVPSGFWQDRRVFITGHSGFKGGWLSLWLQSLGADVCGYSLSPPTRPNLFSVASIESGMQSIISDIRDRERLTTALTDYQPEIIFHLAAQSLVRESYRDPVGTYETNVMGTVNLLEAVRATRSVETVIVITSDKCYENKEWPWGYREHEPLGGYDPYSSSKACSELVSSAYRRSFFSEQGRRVNIATARAGNVIGGGDWAEDRLIPDLFRAFVNGEAAQIRNPAAIRPWQHVMEPLAGYLQLAEAISTQAGLAGGWNFGPEYNDSKTVEWIADHLCQLWGDAASWHSDDQSHPHEAGVLRLDCSKARTQLGWSPALDLAEALALTSDWYRAYTRDQDMRAYTLQQLDAYHSKVNN